MERCDSTVPCLGAVGYVDLGHVVVPKETEYNHSYTQLL